jgi:hypothetical protein
MRSEALSGGQDSLIPQRTIWLHGALKSMGEL